MTLSPQGASGASAELDRLLPVFQFTERHQITVRADTAAAFAAVEAIDLSDSTIARVLQAIWRIPARLFLGPVPPKSMSTRDFIPLSRIPPRDLVRGLVAGAGRRSWTPEEFAAHPGPGFKLAWGFTVTALGEGTCRIDTETRVLCCDAATRRWFTVYWMIIRPWSGLIRRDMLRLMKRRAERRL